MSDTARPLDKLTVRGFKSIEKLEDFELSSQLNIIYWCEWRWQKQSD